MLLVKCKMNIQAKVKPLDYLVNRVVSDTWADLQYPYPGDDTSANRTKLHGNAKQLYLLKKKNRFLKTMLSVASWTYSRNMTPVLASESMRSIFATTAVKHMYNLGSPLYGYAFLGTEGLGTLFNGTGDLGSFGEAGIWDYKALPIANSSPIITELPNRRHNGSRR
jgi:hypothetical protein